MSRIFRHDVITLHSKASEEGFVKFMAEVLIPHFSERYRGPTRTSKADLKGQSLFKDSKVRRKYLWVTVWDGSPESVQGSSFENTRMVRFEETNFALKELDSFGKRATEKIYTELASIEVPTNT